MRHVEWTFAAMPTPPRRYGLCGMIGLKLPVSFRASACEHDTGRRSLTCTQLNLHSLVLVPSSCTGPAVPSLRDAPIVGTMNGFSDHGLDEDAFGVSKKGGIASFDAFRKY